MINITNLQSKRLLPICEENAPQNNESPRPQCGADTPTFLSAVYNRGTQARKRQADAPQSGRLLPICEENAPQFSSDVYNKRYTSAKNASRFKQSGRSMIEMLGVLAIIGVLTVGGIAGFQKAMRQHRLNVMRDQIVQIVAGVKNMYASQHNYNDLTTQVAIDTGIIPPDMVVEDVDNGQYKVKHIYNGNISIDVNTETKEPTFTITINDVPRNAAVDLSTIKWSEDSSLLEIEVIRHNNP